VNPEFQSFFTDYVNQGSTSFIDAANHATSGTCAFDLTYPTSRLFYDTRRLLSELQQCLSQSSSPWRVRLLGTGLSTFADLVRIEVRDKKMSQGLREQGEMEDLSVTLTLENLGAIHGSRLTHNTGFTLTFDFESLDRGKRTLTFHTLTPDMFGPSGTALAEDRLVLSTSVREASRTLRVGQDGNACPFLTDAPHVSTLPEWEISLYAWHCPEDTPAAARRIASRLELIPNIQGELRVLQTEVCGSLYLRSERCPKAGLIIHAVYGVIGSDNVGVEFTIGQAGQEVPDVSEKYTHSPAKSLLNRLLSDVTGKPSWDEPRPSMRF
jgi:hypothetical protein